MTHSIQGVLFDLDGTLLDTACDLGRATNHLLQVHKKPDLPLALLRSSAGHGCKGLLKAAFNITDNHPDFASLCEELFHYYDQHLFDTTTFFPGMETVLNHLESNNIPWGIVTNKPQKFTTKLVERLQLTKKTKCIISGDTFTYRKPHPEPILKACEILQKKPQDCIYIGDGKIDMVASKAAGIPALVALYGYISAEDDPQSWEAHGYINHPLDIMQWL